MEGKAGSFESTATRQYDSLFVLNEGLQEMRQEGWVFYGLTVQASGSCDVTYRRPDALTSDYAGSSVH